MEAASPPELPSAGAPTFRARLVASLAGCDVQPGDDPRVRRTALLATLADADMADAEALVRRALVDEDPLIRREGAEQAGRRPQLAAACSRALSAQLCNDPDAMCREAAAFALGETGHPSAGSALAEALEGEAEPLVIESIVAALGALAYEPGITSVVELATSGEAAVRRRAVVALAAFPDPLAEDTMRRALTDADRRVRATAAWLLRTDVPGHATE